MHGTLFSLILPERIGLGRQLDRGFHTDIDTVDKTEEV